MVRDLSNRNSVIYQLTCSFLQSIREFENGYRLTREEALTSLMSAFTQTAHAQLDRHLEEVEHSIKKIFMAIDGFTQDSQRFQQDIRDQIRRSTAKRKTSAAGGAK